MKTIIDKFYAFILFALGLLVLPQYAVCCDCDLTISKSGSYYNLKEKVQPGQTVCIQAGTYTNLYFFDFVGSATKPIKFINCGGKVIVNSDKAPTGIQFYGCRFFKISGTGSADLKYGILVEKTAIGSQALRIENKSSDCEIEYVEVAGAGFAGIMVKTEPTCDSTTWRGNLAVRNVKIHHNYIHDTHSEGMYIGSTSWNDGYKINCNGSVKTILPHNIYGLQIHHNITERTGAEGIQYGASPDAEVHHNIVRDSGLSPFAAFQNNGMQIGGGVSGNFYNNQILNTPATGIIIIGNLGNTRVYNNLVVNSGANGIFCDDRFNSQPNTRMDFVNNTIVNSGQEGIRLMNEINQNLIANNVIANVGTGRKFVSFSQGATAEMFTNFMTLAADSLGFINLSDADFRLKASSPLIDAGTENKQFYTDIDLDGNRRLVGRGIDIGAFEYHPETDLALTLYPSPCDSHISLWSTALLEQVTVYSLDGKQLIRVSCGSVKNLTLPVDALTMGVYILQADTSLGTFSKRFIKR